MSRSIQDLFDFNLVKRCCRCKAICLEKTLNRNPKSEDRLQSQCKSTVKDYNKKYQKKIHDKLPNYRMKNSVENGGKTNQ